MQIANHRRMNQEKVETAVRTTAKYTAEQLAVLQRAATERGIVGGYAVARYIRALVAEGLERDGFVLPGASKN